MDAAPADAVFASLPPVLGVEPAQASSGADPALDTAPAPIGPGMPRERPVEPAGSPAPEPARSPAARPTGSPVGRSQGPAPAPAGGMAGGWEVEPVGSAPLAGVGSDWGLWWGTFQGAAGARLHVWRCSPNGLNVGEPVQVMTVDDARRLRLDDYATAHGYLRARFGPGRYRLAPRTDQGSRLPGTQSLVVAIEEDHPAMTAPLVPTAGAAAAPVAYDRDTAIEIERMRLQAEMERERDGRRERLREQREERRREREADRERRREEERRRRDEEDRHRADREMQMQTMMVQVLKEVAGGRSGGKEDALLAAVLAKIGQPDPLVLKLLDTHGKREELTDFFKVQAESMRMASSLQTDSLKQVMTASQEVQSHLIRQAAEVAANREGGGGWDGIGTVLSATANIISALRNQQQAGATPSAPAQLPAPAATQARRPVALPPPPARNPAPATVDPVVVSLRLTRAVQQGERADDAASLRSLAAGLSADLAAAIAAGDVAALQRIVLPAVQADPSLGTWLGQPGVGDWLTGYLQRLRVELVGTEPATPQAEPEPADDDPIL